MTQPDKEQRLKQPKEWTYVERGVSEYNGRRFYGEHSHDTAELHYLRDYKRWADRELKNLNAFARSVNEALNSGDGSYRP